MNVETWERLASGYEAVEQRNNTGRKGDLPPLGNASYVKAKAALSMLSDAQERANGDLGPGVNDLINAAKWLIDDIADANRDTHRNLRAV